MIIPFAYIIHIILYIMMLRCLNSLVALFIFTFNILFILVFLMYLTK